MTGAYVLANTGVIASHVPGGVGVLESIVLSLLPGASVLAALLMFRVIYYLAPLALGLSPSGPVGNSAECAEGLASADRERLAAEALAI